MAGQVRGSGSGSAVSRRAELHAWLYGVRPDGTSHPTGSSSYFAKAVPSIATLFVSADTDVDTPVRKNLRVLPAVGMSMEPVVVSPDPDTGHWKIRNGGQTNTLRIQPYGLRAVPLRPRATMAMPGPDVAVWIPFVLRGRQPDERTETFRLLILHAPEPPRAPGPTTNITETKIRALTKAMREGVIMFFGEYLSWPPLPTPHVRQENEVGEIAEQHGLLAEDMKGRHWVRNRYEVLSGRDGLFIVSEAGRWYPPLGGAVRSAGNYLPAFQRLIELGSAPPSTVRYWAEDLEIEPYLTIDEQLLRPPGS